LRRNSPGCGNGISDDDDDDDDDDVDKDEVLAQHRKRIKHSISRLTIFVGRNKDIIIPFSFFSYSLNRVVVK
jgi:hypothetical protein